LTVEHLTYLEEKLKNEVAVLKLQVQEQTKQIYSLYKRIAELNEIHERRNRKQQKNIQECNS
jgi:4-diphosphocytidyl-2C-methyl-D-erythritol kinase